MARTTTQDSTGAATEGNTTANIDTGNNGNTDTDTGNTTVGNGNMENMTSGNGNTDNANTGTTEGGMAETAGNAHETYVIRPGDTLYQISIEKYGSMDVIREICELNGITENQIIYPGQVIVLP